MEKNVDYLNKYGKIKTQTLIHRLPQKEQTNIEGLAHKYYFSQQELKNFVDHSIDLKMWNLESLSSHWFNWLKDENLAPREAKKMAFQRTRNLINKLQQQETIYDNDIELPAEYKTSKIELRKADEYQKVFGKCPVYSEKTVCCNLWTIDAVKNCGFGCSYCSIQTMFVKENVLFDTSFKQKLEQIDLDTNKFYHIGTGQSSDALMWGNSNHIMDDMLNFAHKWPNALIEFKTKSKNTTYLEKQKNLPKNLVCTWSLNPDPVIINEEHLTAKLDERLSSARRIADKGVKVGFHLHPIIFFKDWKSEYANMITKVQEMFSPEEVLFISFGTLSFPKPIIKKIRSHPIKSKILQMPMVPNPEGKMTYPESIKNDLFTHAYQCFSFWHGKVFFYLCMEEKKYWLSTFGWTYENNQEFELDLFQSISKKVKLNVSTDNFN